MGRTPASFLGARREPATAVDRQAMRVLVCEAMWAGAIGLSTSRTIKHRSSDGSNTPMYQASTEELVELAMGLKDADAGLLQVVAGFTEPRQDFEVLRAMVRASGRPLSVSLAQSHERPGDWREILRMVEVSAAEELDISAQGQGKQRALARVLDLEGICELRDPPDYEPRAEDSIAARAPKRGCTGPSGLRADAAQ